MIFQLILRIIYRSNCSRAIVEIQIPAHSTVCRNGVFLTLWTRRARRHLLRHREERNTKYENSVKMLDIFYEKIHKYNSWKKNLYDIFTLNQWLFRNRREIYKNICWKLKFFFIEMNFFNRLSEKFKYDVYILIRI